MKQFGKILKFELKHYLANRVFLGVTVFLVVLIAAVLFWPRGMGALEESGEASEAARPVMLVAADTPERTATVAAVFAEAFPDYQVTAAESAEVVDRVSAGDAECAFEMTGKTEYVYYVNNLSLYDANTAIADEALRTLYRLDAMQESGLSPEVAGEILAVQVTGRAESLGKDQTQNFFYTYLMIMALYIVILLYGQMVATGVATEKSSRAMELLITSARPVSMMFGKVLAACLAGLTQLVAVFGTALICFRLNASYWSGNMIVTSLFGMPLDLFVYMLLFFVLGFLIYAFLFGAIGSTASKLEDINTSVMPLTLMFVVGFMVVMISMSSGHVDSPLMIACSYIPFTSPMAMFTRIAMSTVPAWEIALSALILAGSTAAIGVLAAKIYRVGVLLYGTPPKPRAILKAIRRA